MENKTAEEIIEKTLLLKSHLDYVGVYDNVINCMEEYASIKLAEKDKEIESFTIGVLTWLKNNCSHEYVISDLKLQAIRGNSTWWYPKGQIWVRDENHLIELYKQSLNK